MLVVASSANMAMRNKFCFMVLTSLEGDRTSIRAMNSSHRALCNLPQVFGGFPLINYYRTRLAHVLLDGLAKIILEWRHQPDYRVRRAATSIFFAIDFKRRLFSADVWDGFS